jgi:multicomponent Na+:H+ antiporter subunit D
MDLITLPILIPLVTATAGVVLWKNRPMQQWLGLIGMGGLFVASLALLWQVSTHGIQAVQLGNWVAPFGISLVADLFSAIMVAVSAFVGLCVMIYSIATIDRARTAYGYHAFMNFMLMGVCGAFLTGDLFNLFVWFEVMLISSFVLMALGGERPQMEGAVKYVTINLISSGLFLAAVGLLYGKVGTLNMADLALKLDHSMHPELITVTAMLFLVSFGVKAGIFPLFFWLPASYHTPPVAVSAAFAGLLTKVGVYSLIRIFTLVFDGQADFTNLLLIVIAGLTMVTGVLGAVAQFDFRRLLSFHIISQIGYAIMGLAIFTPWALAGAIYFLVHNIFAKTNLFLVSGAAKDLRGTFYLKKMGSLYVSAPFLSIIFIVAAFGLAGIPPLSGFFGKYLLIKAGFDAEFYIISGIALAVGMLTLFSMTKIFAEAFWKKAPEDAPQGDREWSSTPGKRWALYTPMVAMAIMTIMMGVMAEPFINLCLQAGEQLLNPTEYIQAVLSSDYREIYRDLP